MSKRVVLRAIARLPVPIPSWGMADSSKRIGSGITAETIKLRQTDDLSLREIEAIRDAMLSMPEMFRRKWGPKAPLISMIRERLIEIRSNAPDPDDYVASAAYYATHQTEAWFILTAAKFAKHIETCVAEDRSWEAVSFAYDLGELMTELAFKKRWEKEALAGERLLEAQGQSARMRRRQPREERVAFVEMKLAEGKSARQAFEIAAKHFGVSASTIKKDYYSKKRST